MSETDDKHADRYWAAQPADDLHNRLLARTQLYFRDFRNSPFSALISQNWLYYHGLFQGYEDFNLLDGAIHRTGEQGQYSFMGLNNFRNLLHNLFILTTRDRPATQARADNNDPESKAAAQAVDGLLDSYLREKRVEKNLRRAAEEAIVLTEGFVGVDWDASLGKPITADLQNPQVYHEGDLKVTNYTIYDVVKDMHVADWKDLKWVIVRDRVNKWDLAEMYPAKRSEILNSRDPEDVAWGLIDQGDDKTDQVSYWKFLHLPTPALPTGRRLCFVQGGWLENEPFPPHLDCLPVFRVCPAEVLLAPLGYSIGFDLQGPQEAMNMGISNILTNLDTFGVQYIWSEAGNTFSAATLSGGLRLLQSKVKPEAMQLATQAPDAYKFLEFLNLMMELISGINSVHRGQPEASLKSGKALSIIESKAVQFASALIESYYQLIEDVTTTMVKVLGAKIGESKRVFTIAGRHAGRTLQREMSGADLKKVSRVVVDSANALSKTISGRKEISEELVRNGWVRTAEEYLTVLTTGRLEPILETDQMTLALIASEKEALMEGKIAPVLKSDYHSLHLREELALLSSPEARFDEALTSNILGHCLVHIAMLYLPDVRDLQVAQGFQVPQLGPMVPPGMLDQIGGSEYGDALGPIDQAILQAPYQGPPPRGPPAQRPQQGENAPETEAAYAV